MPTVKTLIAVGVVVAILSGTGLVYTLVASLPPQSTYTVHFVQRGSQSGSLLFYGSSTGLMAELNYTVRPDTTSNSTKVGAGFGFLVWHANGISIKSLNLTFSLGPPPTGVWVSQLSYDTAGYPPLTVVNQNFTGGVGEVSGAFLTLTGFPPTNPTVLYGVGLSYPAGSSEAAVGGTSVQVQAVFQSGTNIPFVEQTYVGSFGFNLA